jgi:cyclopropane fatty-acyl-phospholipid synthase-like methyltransferase
MNQYPMATLSSISENNGLKCLTEKDKKIYSIGISTGGAAEIRMVKNLERHVTATTIDPNGAAFAKKQISNLGLSPQIDVKIEDVSQPLPYPEGYFDFLYARLVLHYLPKQSLESALKELFRILKTDGKMFVVVRSTDCLEAHGKNVTFDPDTGLTTYSSGQHLYSRYFHTEKSIQQYLISAGFSIRYIDTYQEQLCIDFERTKLSKQIDSLIEVLAVK